MQPETESQKGLNHDSGTTTIGGSPTNSFHFRKRLSRRQWAIVIGSVTAIVVLLSIAIALPIVLIRNVSRRQATVTGTSMPCPFETIAGQSNQRRTFVAEWNDVYLNAIRDSKGDSPSGIARAGAMLHGAIFDTINAFDQDYVGYAISVSAPKDASRYAAIAAAARTVMLSTYGQYSATVQAVEALYTEQMKSLTDGTAKTVGISFGTSVADTYISLRSVDVSILVNNSYVQGKNPGDWRPSPPNFGGPVGPQHGRLTPWTLMRPDQFRPPVFPPLNSSAYTKIYEDVKLLGSANSSIRTADQTEIAYFWANDRDGTYKPPGHLNVLTRVVAEQQFDSQGLVGFARENAMARLLALTNIAMADAGIAAWDCKYSFNNWRPIDGIRSGDADLNPSTTGDPNWTPLSAVSTNGLAGYVPGFPAYISGHSTFGAAHAAVMSNFFGKDNIGFTVGTDDPLAVNVTRTFLSFSHAALENGRSRIYLGVHWQADAEEGYKTGTAVGNWAFASLFPSRLSVTRTQLNPTTLWTFVVPSVFALCLAILIAFLLIKKYMRRFFLREDVKKTVSF